MHSVIGTQNYEFEKQKNYDRKSLVLIALPGCRGMNSIQFHRYLCIVLSGHSTMNLRAKIRGYKLAPLLIAVSNQPLPRSSSTSKLRRLQRSDDQVQEHLRLCRSSDGGEVAGVRTTRVDKQGGSGGVAASCSVGVIPVVYPVPPIF
jgi:hypothetical protein